MKIRVEIDKEYIGIIRYQLSFFSLTLVASEFTAEYAILYFDVLPKTIHTIFIGNEPWQNSFFTSIQDITKKVKHFNIAFVESTSSLLLPHYQTLDDEDIFIEVMFPKGAVYPLKSIIDTYITIVNQSTDELIIHSNNDEICTLSILDGAMKEQKHIRAWESSKKSKNSIRLKPEESYKKKIQFKLHMKNSGSYYFVLQTFVQSIDNKTLIYTLHPLPVLIK